MFPVDVQCPVITQEIAQKLGLERVNKPGIAEWFVQRTVQRADGARPHVRDASSTNLTKSKTDDDGYSSCGSD